MAKEKYEIYLTERAQKDFKAIQRYTLKTYGEKQVLKYSQMLKSSIEKIAENPELYGHSRFDIPEGYRSYKVGEHSILFRIVEKQIFIVAILHGSMDFVKQLSKQN